jgi:hypothetical protein
MAKKIDLQGDNFADRPLVDVLCGRKSVAYLIVPDYRELIQ